MGYIGQAPANKVVTSADIEDSAITSAKILDGTIANADVNDMASSKLTGALPAISGASLTNLDARDLENALPAISGASLTALNATNLGSGTVPTARLGSGTASGNFLRGDSTWAAAGGGKILQVVQGSFRNAETSTTSSTVVNGGCTVAITPSATSSKILVMFTASISDLAETTGAFYDISRAISGGTTTAGIIGAAAGGTTTQGMGGHSAHYGVLSTQYVDSPSTTSAVTYQLMIGRWFGSGTVYIHNNSTNSWSIAIEIDGS